MCRDRVEKAKAQLDLGLSRDWRETRNLSVSISSAKGRQNCGLTAK